jgi:hypothetical protein
MQRNNNYSYKLKNIGFDLSFPNPLQSSRSNTYINSLTDLQFDEVKNNLKSAEIDQLKKDLSTDTISLTNKNTQNEDNNETISDDSCILDVNYQCESNNFVENNEKILGKTKRNNIIIKAYKSKLKMKRDRLYLQNSDIFKQNTKDKIFHKCNFPGCSRTFASSGWLKAHLIIHDEEMYNHSFNRIFNSIVILNDVVLNRRKDNHV